MPVASSSFTAAVKTTGPVTVAAYSTAFNRNIRDARSFTLLRPDELPLLIHPHITATYFKILDPWTGSRSQASARAVVTASHSSRVERSRIKLLSSILIRKTNNTGTPVSFNTR